MRALPALLLVIAAHPAHAEVPSGDMHLAIGVNAPLGWSDGSALGASVYVGLGEHHALRANLARYNYSSGVLPIIGAILTDSDGDEASYRGQIQDVGLAWVYHPRGWMQGFLVELGVLRRARDVRVSDEAAIPAVVATSTTSYAGRVLVGRSWLISRHFFFSVAVGVAAGGEAGFETTQRDETRMPVTRHVWRSDVSSEGLLRLGAAFDL
jgi:hypothetical protein